MKEPRGAGLSSVNAADGDEYDEEAERQAFQDAVNAWRKGSNTSKGLNGTEATTKPSVKGGVVVEREYENEKADSGMWRNPFAPSPSPSPAAAPAISLRQGVLDEEQEHQVRWPSFLIAPIFSSSSPSFSPFSFYCRSSSRR